MFNQTQAWKEYLKRRENAINQVITRDLFNDKTFYRAFAGDLLAAKKEVIIYSPFVSKFRANYYKRIIEKLRNRNIEVFIFTRTLDEYDSIIQAQIEHILEIYQKEGVHINYFGKYIHEKTAIIDRKIVWEGSLNILSHRASSEMMTKTLDNNLAENVMSMLNLNNSIANGYKIRYEECCHNLTTTKCKQLNQIRNLLVGCLIILTLILFLFFKDSILHALIYFIFRTLF